MFCQNCGHELAADAKFCPECGTKTTSSRQVPAASAVKKDEAPAKAEVVQAYTTGQDDTCEAEYSTSEWECTCPKCNGEFTQSQVPCPLCKTNTLMYVRTVHAHGDAAHNNYRRWLDCYIECTNCHTKFKAFFCPKGDSGLIALARINVFMPEHESSVYLVLAAVVALVLGLIAWPMSAASRNVVPCIVAGVAWLPITLGLKRVFPLPKKWLNYTD